MNGYILCRDPQGRLLRLDRDRSTRKALVRDLEDSVPGGMEAVGIVLGEAEPRHLRLIHEAA